MPKTPNIPNEAGAFGLYTGANDPSLQYAMPSLQEGVVNLYPERPGLASTLPLWKFAWNFPGPLQIIIAGDSIVQGFGNGGVVVPFSHRLHQILMNFTGLTDGGMGLMLPSWQGVTGSGVTKTGTPLTQGAGYGVGSLGQAVNAGNSITFNTANATFCTGTNKVQTMDVLYVDIGAFGGDVNYKIDGGATQTLVTAKLLDKQVKSVRIPTGAAPGGFAGNTTHAVEVFGSGPAIVLVGVIVYSGTAGPSGVMVHNAGVGGVTLDQYTAVEAGGAPNASALSFVAKIAPQLMISHLGANDTINAGLATPAKMLLNYSKLVASTAFIGADHILMSPPPWSPNALGAFPQKDLTNPGVEQQILNMCLNNNLPMLNLRACWGDWNNYSVSNVYSGDGVIHPNELGHKDMAARLHRILLMA